MIVVMVRTRNEELNIERFCKSYEWADRILIADGWSTDNTLSIASEFPNVKIRRFSVFQEMDNWRWRNPEAEHLNFLLDWAQSYSPDWIISDDADGLPNKLLRERGEETFSECHKNYLRAVRIYLYHENSHLSGLSKQNGKWLHSLWAWRPEAALRYKSSIPAYTMYPLPKNEAEFCDLQPPLCLLHNSWPSDEEVENKLAFYRESGQIATMQHPLDFGGARQPLETWMEA